MDIPLYYKIYNDLLRKIGSEEYPPGSVLPTDGELEELYGVSKAPVRQALEKLKNEGLIERHPGRRTRVRELKRSTPWLLQSGLQRHYSENWTHLTCKTHLVEVCQPPGNARAFFGVTSSTLLPHLIRVRSLGNKPVVVMHNYLAPELASVNFCELGDFSNLKECLFVQRGLAVTLAEEKLIAVAIHGENAQYLKVKEGSPQLLIRRYSYDQHKLPLAYDEHYVNSNIWQYEVAFLQ
ncbi:HTH-type transcriptional repressor NagR [Fretibacterium fastidiosum]